MPKNTINITSIQSHSSEYVQYDNTLMPFWTQLLCGSHWWGGGERGWRGLGLWTVRWYRPGWQCTNGKSHIPATCL